jgi:hypothetical protein
MTSTVKYGGAFILLFVGFVLYKAFTDTEPLSTSAQVNQAMLEDCLKADRDRIKLYGEARPTHDCLVRELKYAAKQTK